MEKICDLRVDRVDRYRSGFGVPRQQYIHAGKANRGNVADRAEIDEAAMFTARGSPTTL
jgi:hypothetical protein